MKINKNTFLMFIFLFTGVGLFSYFQAAQKNQSEEKAFNPFALTQEEAVKSGPPSVRVYLAALNETQESVISLEEFLRCARQETGYRGIFDDTYNPFQTSSAAAQGAWQVRVVAAREVWKQTIKHMTNDEVEHKLKYDIEWCGQTALKYAELMHSRYNNKEMAFAAYNRGPGNVSTAEDINSYAKAIVK